MLRKLPRRRWLALALALVGVASAVLAGTVLAAGTTFTVNSTGDAPDANLSDGQCQTATSNECTLRAAIQQANNLSTNAGLDTIKFNIPGSGVKTIAPNSRLPKITDPVTIDGYTQGDGTADDATPNTLAIGDNAHLLIELNGASAGSQSSGLDLAGTGGSTVRGLVINSFSGHGIVSERDNTIEGNYIGTDTLGTTDRGNSLSGVDLIVANDNTIGGTTAAARNVISGNDQYGVLFEASSNSGNQVQGNYIGTKANGTEALGNSLSGVAMAVGNDNTIGGTTDGERNVISGNGSGGGGSGVDIQGGSGNRVQGNYIGTKANGTEPLGNSFSGVNLFLTSNNTIGGTTDGERNVISGNESDGGGSGVFIQGASGNRVQGNYIGTKANGTEALGNHFRGVVLKDADNNTIGGTAPGAGNVISGNTLSGVFVSGSGSNQVQGNYIGTDKNGTAPLGNSSEGINIDSGSGHTIGGTAAGAGNVISSNQGDGVFISGSDSQVQGNYIGTDKNGTRPASAPDLGNSGAGVDIGSQGANNTIGGTASGAGNVISDNATGVFIGGNSNQVVGNHVGTDASGTTDLGNSSDGVAVSGTNDSILSNSIFANGDLGIDLAPNGVTQNDPGDVDFGANNHQNFPVLAPFASSSGTTTIKGTLNSTPSTTFTVQFFSSPQADSSGYGEGKTFLGERTDVTTDGSGNASFTFTTAPALSSADVVTATATNQSTNDTSEFSKAQNANDAPTVDLSGPATANEGDTKDYTFTVADPDSGDSFTLKSGFPDCGTGGQLVSSSTTASGGSFECSFADGPASPEVRVQVTDSNDADSNLATRAVTVNNVAPTISAVSADPSTIEEGSSSTIKVDATDPAGSNDTLTYAFDCNNDNTYETGPQSGNTAQCTFADSGTSTVNVRVTDEDGGEDTDSTTVNVSNVAPTVTLSGPTTANEGDTKDYTFTVTDPGVNDTQTITTGCGDNGEKVAGSDTYDQASGNGSFQCRFPDGPATSDVTVKATDSDGASDTDNRRVTVTVANVAPQAEDQSVQTNEGEAKTITLKGSDRGEGDNLSFEITDQPDHGSLGPVGAPTCTGTTNRTCSANVTYTPNASFTGTDTFTYKANDGVADSNEATVEIIVNDTVAPTVTGVTPAAGAKRVPRKTSPTATFSEEMNPSTLSASTVKLQQWNKEKKKWQTVTASVRCDTPCKKVTLNPYPANPPRLLAANKKFRVIVTTGVKDKANHALDQNPTKTGNQGYSWTFTTRSG